MSNIFTLPQTPPPLKLGGGIKGGVQNFFVTNYIISLNTFNSPSNCTLFYIKKIDVIFNHIYLKLII